MIDLLTDPFAQGIGLRALLELVILGAVCGPLGVWVVLYRQSYAAESLAHSMLPGLVLAAVIGAPLGVGAAGGLMVAAACIAAASRRRAVTADVAVAVAITALFGAGTLLALSPEAPIRLGELLFGDPLSVSWRDLIASGALALVLLSALLTGNRSLTLVGFDIRTAPSLGTSPALVSAALLALLALTTLIAVQALGNLLVVAIVIAPAAAALRVSARLPRALTAAAGIAIGSGVAGLYLSYYADLAAGASIALCACAAFLLSLPFGGAEPAGGLTSGSPVDALGSVG
jgi:ABC-type Mn2+/Zn2+ transport system permease subunit